MLVSVVRQYLVTSSSTSNVSTEKALFRNEASTDRSKIAAAVRREVEKKELGVNGTSRACGSRPRCLLDWSHTNSPILLAYSLALFSSSSAAASRERIVPFVVPKGLNNFHSPISIFTNIRTRDVLLRTSTIRNRPGSIVEEFESTER